MAVTVVLDSYTDICGDYMYGKEFLDLPDSMQDNLDDFFDGFTLDFANTESSTWKYNPDNLWVGFYNAHELVDLLDELKISHEDEDGTFDIDQLHNLYKENEEKINDHLKEEYSAMTILGYNEYEKTVHVI